MDIMMRLKGSGFSVIANEFHEREKRLGGGLPLQDFVEIVLQGLPRAKNTEEKRANVSALVDLFDEIDINGDGVMEFDEFTSFCVDAGMVATRVKTSAAAGLKHRYVRSAKHVIKTASGCVGIEKVKWSPAFRRLLALENTAKSVKLFDITGRFLAEIGGKSTINVLPVTPRANESNQDWQRQEISDSNGRTTERGRPQSGKPSSNALRANDAAGSRASSSAASNTTTGIFILDAVFIFKYKWLALSTTDFCISFYDMDESRKPPIAALLPDSATAAARSGPSFELIKPLTITTTTAQLLLRFCEQAALLFSSGNDFVLNVWKIVDAETKVLWKRLVLHQDMVMDLIEVPQHDMIVSCDLHRSIQLWDLHDCRSRGALIGHSHGVKQLVYSSHHDLLLSAGFEFDAYGWDIASRQVAMKLSGHRAPLVGVQIALFQTERAVTADCTGVFKVWDISRGSGGMASASSSASSRGGHGTASQAIQLESIDPSQHFARFEPTAFICMHPHSRDLWTATAGTATLHRFRSTRVQQLGEIPLRAFYHYNANKFIVVAGPTCSIWDGETGTCLEEFSHVGNISNSSSGSGKAGDSTATPGASGSSGVAAGGNSSSNNNTAHNGSDSSTSSEPCVEVLACVQDQSCKKVVVVTERGELGVFNALNFVQMRKCQEVFYGQAKVAIVPTATATGSTNPASAPTPAPGTGQPVMAVPMAKNRSCGIVGLHYCSVNKLIIATDANESAILVIDDNTSHVKDTTVLRRLTSVPGGISASAYGFHTCLVATISDQLDETGDDSTSVSLWDFETLSFVGKCEFHKEHEGHVLHLLEFWDEFPVLLGADTLGGVYFYAATPLINCNTGKLLHSFSNDHDCASQPASKATGTRRKATGAIFESMNEDDEDETDANGDQPADATDKTFMTETAEFAARKLLKWRTKSVASKENTAEPTSSESKPPGCTVTCMKVVYDDASERYVLFTGDESGMVRLWDLSKMITRLSLFKIPEIKCKFLRRGYHPKATFTRDYIKDTMANDSDNLNGYNKHQPLLAQGGDWRAALLTGDDHDPHFQLTQTDLKRLSRRRLESKKRSTVGVMVPSKLQTVNRAAQHANTATVAFAAAEAFLRAPKGGVRASAVGLKKRSSLVSLSKASSTAQQRRHSQHQQFDDIQIVYAWKAHSDGLTSIEVTKNPAIVVTCALDMRVFVWDWQGNCLGKLFDAENIGKWKWLFRKDDSKRQQERDELVQNLMRDLELTPLEKAHRRRQTLYQEHTERKSLKDMQKVSTILLEHIISKNPELELLKTDNCEEEEDTRSGGSPTQGDTLSNGGGQSKMDHSEEDTFARNVHVRQPPGGQQLSSSKSSLHTPERVNHLRLHSLAQVGPLLCVNKFEYKKQSLATGKTKFAELDDLKMDKKYLEQELSISFPTSLSSSSCDKSGASHNNNMSDVQSQIQVAHVAAKAAFESRATLERKTADMYVNLEKAKHRTKKAAISQQQQKGSERVNQELDMELLEPSEFLKKHIPASKLSIRPQTAPAVQKRLQQIRKLPPSSSNQLSGGSGAKQTQSTASLPKPGGDHSSALSLKSSISTPLLAPSQRQSVDQDRRKSSMDIGFMEEVKRHTKHKEPVVRVLASPNGANLGRRASAIARAGGIGSIVPVGETPGDRAEERGGGDEGEGGLSLRKLRAINQILSKAQQYCSPVKESASMSNNNNRPSTAPFSRLTGKSTAISTGCNSSPSSVAQLTKSDHKNDGDDDDPDHEGESEDSFDTGDQQQQGTAAADARVREHLEETKRRMASAMRDGERSPHRSDLKKIRQSSREQQKVRRMEDYLQQKRREMNTNIGNVFKRTSFVFQSKATDDPMTTLAAANGASNSSIPGTRPSKMDTTLSPSNKAKLDLEKSATVFGIYGVREVMSVIRLFWSMDEDNSGNISLEELLQYKHFFEKLGYNDMATVFQAIDKDGNGHVSLKELLEICFHYATKYQIEEMLKLAKVGNVRSYMQGDDGGPGSGVTGGKDAAAALSQEHRRELLDIFRVFDKNGDGGVSMQELMEALRVDDDDVMAKVMTEEATRSKSSNEAAMSSGITKEDVERLYSEFDSDRNATLDFDEFVALMRTLYGPKSNMYFR